jgi:hypothetical protein
MNPLRRYFLTSPRKKTRAASDFRKRLKEKEDEETKKKNILVLAVGSGPDLLGHFYYRNAPHEISPARTLVGE